MNRIEERLATLQAKKEKAFITYLTAGLPNMEATAAIVKAQEEAGTDIIEIGVPFSDPIADGPVIQQASYEAIQAGANLKKSFELIAGLRADGVKLPIVFMLYYNTVLHYGLENFVKKCQKIGVDGLIIPDLPLEEQGPIKQYLTGDETILIQLVSPVSAGRIGEIVKSARGFIYCVSSMGVTGQSGSFHKEILGYLSDVKKQSPVPVMMGFGITEAKDVAPMKDVIDGAIVGSAIVKIIAKYGKDAPTYVGEYVKSMKDAM